MTKNKKQTKDPAVQALVNALAKEGYTPEKAEDSEEAKPQGGNDLVTAAVLIAFILGGLVWVTGNNPLNQPQRQVQPVSTEVQ